MNRNFDVLHDLFDELEQSGSDDDYNAVMDELESLENYASSLLKDYEDQGELNFN